ncbi:MAG: DNA-directed RNA polymerase subunit H [Halobacteria archaeon]
MKIRPSQHDLVPRHEKAAPEEVKQVLQRLGITKDLLPKIRATDPAAEEIGAQPGDVIKIYRKSETAGEAIVYRVTVS